MNMRKWELKKVLTQSNHEYELAIPDGTVCYTLQARKLSGVQYDFRNSGTTGRVASATDSEASPYEVSEAGTIRWDGPGIQLNDFILYVASSQAGLEIQASGFTTKGA